MKAYKQCNERRENSLQAALPLGPPVALNTYGATAALLVGIAVFPGQQLSTEVILFKSDKTVKAVTTSEFLTQESSLGSEEEPLEESERVPAQESVNGQLLESAKESNELNTPAQALTLRQELLEHARTWIGVPYLWGGEGRTGIDCSALVQKVYAKYGITLPRNSQEQFRQGEGVALVNLLPGDLVFFSTNGPGASHVGIYLSDGEFLSATRRQVEIQSLDSPYWQKAYRGSRRILP